MAENVFSNQTDQGAVETAEDDPDFLAVASESTNSYRDSSLPSSHDEEPEQTTITKTTGRATLKSLKLEVKKLRDALRKRDERKAKSTGKMGRPRKSFSEVGRRQKNNLIKEAWTHLETTYGSDAAPHILRKLYKDHIPKEEAIDVNVLSAADTIDVLREAKITMTQLRVLKQQMALRGLKVPLASERAVKEWRKSQGDTDGSDELAIIDDNSNVRKELVDVVEATDVSNGIHGALEPLQPTVTTYLTPTFLDTHGYAAYTTDAAYFGNL